MKLYLMRHGIAAEADNTPDTERPLTKEGRERMEEEAAGLRALDVRVDVVVSSDLPRAKETAEILARALSRNRVVETLGCLAPGGNFAEFMKWLDETGEGDVLAVGHMPDIGEWTARCLTGYRNIGLIFKKGAICCLSFEGDPAAGQAQLEWLMQPASLRRINR